MAISTQVTDSANGRPAAGVPVRLDKHEHGGWNSVAAGATGRDGRLANWPSNATTTIDRGLYRLVFDTNAYFAELGVAAFYPEVAVVFVVANPAETYHVVLVVGPFAYVTYRGQ